MKPVTISEVGPRDGLQNCAGVMPTEAKCRWITALYKAGLREIEVGSFVPPRYFPQLADTAEVAAHANSLPGLRTLALVPNPRGTKAAIEAGVSVVGFPLSVSAEHHRRNMRQSQDDALRTIADVRALIDGDPAAQRPGFEVTLSTSFGCSIAGRVSERDVVRMAERAMEAGADGIELADTVGYATPDAVTRLVRAVRGAVGEDAVQSIHLHNTYGLGLTNAYAALEAGITTLDSSQGGLGGCPAAPGASGNIVTEDLVYMLEAMGVDTGVDVEALIACRQIVADALPDEPLYGMIPGAGLPTGFRTAGATA